MPIRTNEDEGLTQEQQRMKEMDRQFWAEIFRLLALVRGGTPEEELLTEALNGRELSNENVEALYRLATQYFEREARDRIVGACTRYMGTAAIAKLQQPKRKYGILDEMADEAVARGEKDEFLEGLRHAG